LRDFATRQIRLFLFAGHDSTSSTICFCIYHFYRNPDAIQRIREEHDRIFGKDLSTLPSVLTAQPHLAKDLPYTTAVIKEALRHFPPVSGICQGYPDAIITDEMGHQCPTDQASVYSIHSVMQVAPKYWLRASEFLPERWLVEPGHELYTAKNTWRPFENGPRNCIAQGLVMLELRVVLVHIVREFQFADAYEEFDRSNQREGLNHYHGQRAYLIEEGASQLVDHLPCKVSIYTK
jgi:cytochrome P450